MGKRQSKCSCGDKSEVEVIATCDRLFADPESEDPLMRIMMPGAGTLAKKSGYVEWSTHPGMLNDATFKAYPCQDCAKEIGDKLDELDGVDYIMNKSEKGYWTTDLP